MSTGRNPQGAADRMETPGDHPPFSPGDRLRLLARRDDPNPIPPGSLGTVIWCQRLSFCSPPCWQIEVKWDDFVSRGLSLCIPPDRAEKILPSLLSFCEADGSAI